jgi:predicted ferric reductase
MIALSSPILWYTSRAAGIVTFVLLTIVMVFGIMTATRVGNDQVPRFAVAELHRRLSLLAAVFVALHVLTTAIDSYVPTGFLSIILPGASSYKTIWVAFGTVAIDLMIAVIATSLLRQHLSHDAWRAIHWLSYLMWPVALVHVIMIGSDLKRFWMLGLLAACAGAVALALLWRVWAHPHPGGALTAVPKRTARRPSALSQRSVPSPKPPASGSRPVASTKRRPR